MYPLGSIWYCKRQHQQIRLLEVFLWIQLAITIEIDSGTLSS